MTDYMKLKKELIKNIVVSKDPDGNQTGFIEVTTGNGSGDFEICYRTYLDLDSFCPVLEISADGVIMQSIRFDTKTEVRRLSNFWNDLREESLRFADDNISDQEKEMIEVTSDLFEEAEAA